MSGEAARERAVANSLVGFYEETRKRALPLLQAYDFTITDPDHDPDYPRHREHLAALIRLCDQASDALVVDYGG